jgi:hypothetical protein
MYIYIYIYIMYIKWLLSVLYKNFEQLNKCRQFKYYTNKYIYIYIYIYIIII